MAVRLAKEVSLAADWNKTALVVCNKHSKEAEPWAARRAINMIFPYK